MKPSFLGTGEARLSDVTEIIQYGYTANSSFEAVGPKYLRITDIQEEQVDWAAVPHVAINQNDLARFQLSPGDIVFARSGATVGKSFLIKGNPGQAVFASYLIRVKCDANFLDPRYAAYFFGSSDYWRQIRAGVSGTGQPNFNGTKLSELRIPIQPLAIQRQVVGELDKYFSRVKSIRLDLARLPKLIDRYKQAILAKAFSGDLAADWRQSRNLSMASWVETTLGEVTANVRYGTSAKCYYEPQETPVLRIPNIVKGSIDTSDLKYGVFEQREIEKLSLELGDILVIRSNGSLDLVGRTAIVDPDAAGYLFAGYLIRLRLKLDHAQPDFVHYALQEPSTRQVMESLAKSTSGVNNINSEQLKSLKIMKPSLAEQNEIVARIKTAFSTIAKIESECEHASSLLDRLDQAALDKAFCGDLI